MEAIKNLISLPGSNGDAPLENFSHIELSEEEQQAAFEQALYEARKQKHFKLNRERYRAAMIQEVSYPTYTAEQLRQVVIKRGTEQFGNFVIDEDNERIIDLLCLYFSGNTLFESAGANFSLRKGIYLFGDIGCGKTALMRLFMDNSFRSFSMVNCSQVANDFQAQGTAIIDKYAGEIQSSRPDLTFGQKLIGVCFDDLGTEDIKKNYGNVSNVMGEILFIRHANQYKISGQTHLTTNLITDEISTIYGDRIRSRMKEMFNIIEFPSHAKDRRK